MLPNYYIRAQCVALSKKVNLHLREHCSEQLAGFAHLILSRSEFAALSSGDVSKASGVEDEWTRTS